MSQLISDLRAGGGLITSVQGGNNITVNTVGTVATVNVSGTTNHAVQVGNALGALTSIGIGLAGQVLTSNGPGLDPSFQALPGFALTFNGNTGSATPAANVIIFNTANATPIFAAAGNTLLLNFGLQNLLLGSSGSGITTGLLNVGVGLSALSSITSGVSNAAVGTSALSSNSTGGFNTAIGANALAAVNSNSNTAVGFGALGNLTTGDSNVAMGVQALLSTTASIGNTVIGNNAAGNMTSGDVNTIVGRTACANLLSGSYNITVGYLSGNSLTGAESSNILIGNAGLAGQSNAIYIGNYGVGNGLQNKCFIASCFSNFGTQNTFSGELSGNTSLTIGSSIGNSALGYQSLDALTTGAGNVAVGQSAGSALTSGDQNVAVGLDALENIVSGSENIALGNAAGSAYTTNESSNIVIGNIGTIADSACIRIGTLATHTSCFIQGIASVVVSNTQMVTIDTTTGQLGSASLSPSTLFPWSVISIDQTAVVNNGYFCNKAGTLALALPAVSAVGDVIEVSNINTATGTQFTQAAGQQIFIGNTSTTLGAAGTLTSIAVGDSLKIVCSAANTTWRVVSGWGNWSPA